MNENDGCIAAPRGRHVLKTILKQIIAHGYVVFNDQQRFFRK